MPLRILANENIPGPVIQLLRADGHEVIAVREIMPGAEDDEVLARAQVERALVVTFDKDFGELAFRAELPAECGIVLFRLSGPSPEVDNARVVHVLSLSLEWTGSFAVVTDDRIRLRELPRL